MEARKKIHVQTLVPVFAPFLPAAVGSCAAHTRAKVTFHSWQLMEVPGWWQGDMGCWGPSPVSSHRPLQGDLQTSCSCSCILLKMSSIFQQECPFPLLTGREFSSTTQDLHCNFLRVDVIFCHSWVHSEAIKENGLWELLCFPQLHKV